MVSLILTGKGRVLKLVYVLMLLFLLSAGLILASRGIFLAFVAGIAWMMSVAARYLRRKTLVIAIVTLAAIFGLAFLLPGTEGLVERFQGENIGTLNTRTVIWQQALGHFSQLGPGRMIFGQGLNSPNQVLGVNPISNLLNYHNQYLKYMMEQGVAGLFAFLAFLYALTRRALRSRHPLKPVMFGWLGLLLVAAMSGTTADGQGFWILLGVVAGVSGLPDGLNSSPKPFLPRINPPLSRAPSGMGRAAPRATISPGRTVEGAG